MIKPDQTLSTLSSVRTVGFALIVAAVALVVGEPSANGQTAESQSVVKEAPLSHAGDDTVRAVKSGRDQAVAWINANNAFGQDSPFARDVTKKIDGEIAKEFENLSVAIGSGLMKSGQAHWLHIWSDQMFVFPLSDYQARQRKVNSNQIQLSTGQRRDRRQIPPLFKLEGLSVDNSNRLVGSQQVTGQVSCNGQGSGSETYALRLSFQKQKKTTYHFYYLKQSLTGSEVTLPFSFPAINSKEDPQEFEGPLVIFVDVCTVSEDGRDVRMTVHSNTVAALLDVKASVEGHRLVSPSLEPVGPSALEHPEAAQELFSQLTREHYEQALAINQRLYPRDKYPQGHPELIHSLDQLAHVLHLKGEYDEARKYQELALEMSQRYYPPHQFPQGHPVLARSLHNLGFVLTGPKAIELLEEALAMYESLYPADEHFRGHIELARCLDNLGAKFGNLADYGRSTAYIRRSLAMRRRLYPEHDFPQGHHNLAIGLNSLGSALVWQGENEQARRYYKEALAMWQRLYPQGHPRLAGTMDNLAGVLESLGEYNQAREYREKALVMRQRLYPKGHGDVALSLNNLGCLLHTLGEYDRARECHGQALAIWGSSDHARAMSLMNLGAVFRAQGEDEPARESFEQALANFERCYPEEQYPQGHPELAGSLESLGLVLMAQREYQAACGFLEQGTKMRHDLAGAFFARASEAEALNFAAKHLPTPNLLLSAWRHTDKPDGDLYAYVWMRRGMVHRQMALRQQTLQEAKTPMIRDLYAQYIDTRQKLARLTLAPADPDPAHAAAKHARLATLSNRKEELERKLADELPEFRRQLEQQRRPHTDLAEHLPQGTVFIDVVHYGYLEQDPKVPGRAGQRGTRSYVAFILRTGNPVARVELGPAGPIDEAVVKWRNGIVTGRSSPAAKDVRHLVWEPLEKHLTAETKTVVLCPDGALTALPWAALPGKDKDGVLLEEYAFAVVPYGQFLLERLTSEPTTDDDQGLLLAVGDVGYDDKPTRVAEPVLLASRAAIRGDGQLHWSFLPGTKHELDGLLTAAGNRQILKLNGNKAGTTRVLTELPKVRWAHLATHGFFADPNFRSALQLDEQSFQRGQFVRSGERTTVAGRNPLVLSGLVLAGANLPRATDGLGISQGDGGILTAESIAGLPLQNLELAVLSACETGLGEVAGGEGVFGLQRAFHISGAHTTLASLWKVDDEATRQLMTAFYNNMWQKGMGKLEALRQAQRSILNGGGASASIRGPGAQDRERPAAAQGQRADPRLWAAWVLSGDWR